MRVEGTHYQSIWMEEGVIKCINQLELPFRFRVDTLDTPEDALEAIKGMKVRGAPLIGATAAAGIYLALAGAGQEAEKDGFAETWGKRFSSARPTAVNLAAMVSRMLDEIPEGTGWEERTEAARQAFLRILAEEKESCRMIGVHGLKIIEEVYGKTGKTVNILTHCNAGWLACIDYGTATAPVYLAHEKGIPVHVWVDETRPRNQGSRLTAWELKQEGIPHTIVVDNAGGYLMQKGLVDMVLVGSDRTTASGDVANKIGTYLKALAARDNGISFYVALPSSSIDWNMKNGLREIAIEERAEREVRYNEGWNGKEWISLPAFPETHPVANPGFDITPAGMVTALITEKGICLPGAEGMARLFNRNPSE